MKIKYKYSKRAFSRWTKSSAYWAGFIMADGCLNLKKHSVAIGLKSSDRAHIEKFANFMQCEHPIYDYSSYCKSRNKTYYGSSINISSIALYQQLQSFEIEPCKSLTALCPKSIPCKYEIAYLRGLFDGDGTICRYRRDSDYYKFSVIGTWDIINNVRRIVENILGESFGTIYPAGKVWRYQINSTKQVVRIGNALYKGTSSVVRLDRKYNLYREIQSLKEPRRP